MSTLAVPVLLVAQDHSCIQRKKTDYPFPDIEIYRK